MTTGDTDDLSQLRARIETLEAKGAATGFYATRDWKELLWMLGLPLALILTCLTFHDQVWKHADKDRSAEIAAVQRKMVEFLALSAEIHALEAEGPEARSLEARQIRRSRLTDDATVFWQNRSGYFNADEKQTLAHELLQQGRTDVALKIASALENAAETPVARADLEMIKGRIVSADGPLKDLDAARVHMKKALKISEGLTQERQHREMAGKIATSWLSFELWNDTGCEAAAPVAGMLGDIVTGEGGIELDVLQGTARTLLEIHAARCPA